MCSYNTIDPAKDRADDDPLIPQMSPHHDPPPPPSRTNSPKNQIIYSDWRRKVPPWRCRAALPRTTDFVQHSGRKTL